MKTIVRTAAMAGSIAALSACGIIHPEAFNREAMTAPPPASASATAYQRSLHQGYSSFGQWEYQQADFRDAAYFWRKAKAAGAGQNVPPTNPGERKIASSFLSELNPAYSRLTSALSTPGAPSRRRKATSRNISPIARTASKPRWARSAHVRRPRRPQRRARHGRS
jgi:hypothetical protein